LADGIVRTEPRRPLVERQARAASLNGELMWPWETLPPPPRWQRQPWQVGAVEVAGRVESKRCRLGRGPRSAAGPDLRDWLQKQDSRATVTEVLAPPGERWL